MAEDDEFVEIVLDDRVLMFSDITKDSGIKKMIVGVLNTHKRMNLFGEMNQISYGDFAATCSYQTPKDVAEAFLDHVSIQRPDLAGLLVLKIINFILLNDPIQSKDDFRNLESLTVLMNGHCVNGIIL